MPVQFTKLLPCSPPPPPPPAGPCTKCTTATNFMKVTVAGLSGADAAVYNTSVNTLFTGEGAIECDWFDTRPYPGFPPNTITVSFALTATKWKVGVSNSFGGGTFIFQMEQVFTPGNCGGHQIGGPADVTFLNPAYNDAALVVSIDPV